MAHASPFLVLLMDSRRAILFRRVAPDYTVVRQWCWSSAPAREQGDDAPGRTMGSSDRARRAAYEQTDRHQLDERRAAEEVADVLCELAHADSYDRLVICAPPRMLGYLRPLLDSYVLSRLRAEIAKDMVNLPTATIERIISRELDNVAPGAAR